MRPLLIIAAGIGLIALMLLIMAMRAKQPAEQRNLYRAAVVVLVVQIAVVTTVMFT